MKRWNIWPAFFRLKGNLEEFEIAERSGQGGLWDVLWGNWDLVVSPDEIYFAKETSAIEPGVKVRHQWRGVLVGYSNGI